MKARRFVRCVLLWLRGLHGTLLLLLGVTLVVICIFALLNPLLEPLLGREPLMCAELAILFLSALLIALSRADGLNGDVSPPH